MAEEEGVRVLEGPLTAVGAVAAAGSQTVPFQEPVE